MLTPRLYFAYGANISKTAMRYRCPTAKPIESFDLAGWELELYNHATVKPAVGKSVPGVLWEITTEDEQSLDAFEGFPYYYVKQTVTQNGKTFFFYVMNEGRDGYPSKGYVSGISEGYQQWGISTKALERAIDNVNQRLHTTR
jgi:gamma-glutamylcyclotransferase (GGCT)/AIG2-like uncharacterized protein YtfP